MLYITQIELRSVLLPLLIQKAFLIIVYLCPLLLASHLIHLSVAYNTFGSQGIGNLIMALPRGSLRHLNMSSTMDETGNQELTNLVDFMEVCE